MPQLFDIPLFRQRITPTEWEQYGGSILGDCAEWSDRACGMACLRMILTAYGRPAPTVTELLLIGVERDALTERGWVHAQLAAMAADFGVPGHAEPVPAGELTARLNDAPLIISITEQFPIDGRKGGHLIVAHGSEDAPDPVIHFRDPSGWGQTHDRVPLSRLAASYTGRRITFPPLSRALEGRHARGSSGWHAVPIGPKGDFARTTEARKR
ncbi:ABC-type bacteriocin/lantibiotic exporter with double-glycine peptidase domain [Streptacidiphilus sp. MAP12-33]|uniref:hypothetical protein n=1 Tax=Streptacidiphilus sp. MAP12-33 TaxID=3156266 RepID=UPI003515BE85